MSNELPALDREAIHLRCERSSPVQETMKRYLTSCTSRFMMTVIASQGSDVFFSCYNNGTGYTNGIGFRKEIESILFCNMDSISFSEFFFSILEIIFFNLKKKKACKKNYDFKVPT